MPTLQVRDVELLYETKGDGRRVLFIGGTGGDLRQRPSVLDGPLTERCAVLAYDQRGMGRSSKPDRTTTMADYADDAAALCDALEWRPTAVVGVSFGGMVAQELTIRRPDLVDRLVLCCTSSGGAGGASYPLHELQDLPEDERLATQLAISDTRVDRAWQAAHPADAAKLFEGMRARAAVSAGEPGIETGSRRQMDARRHHDTWDRLASIAVPTLVCAGRYDGIAPVANSEALASRIPAAALEVFEGGHLFLLQDRRAWPAIVDWLTRR